jgi:hypothetical protein
MSTKRATRSKKSQMEHLVAAVKSQKLQLPDGYSMPQAHPHHDSFTSIRQTTYRGKAIRVETTYKITIDGEPVTAHTQVLDDGTVHYHGFPNYSFRSALDLARKIVDFSSVEIPKNELGTQGSGSHGGHH